MIALSVIGRKQELFSSDIAHFENELREKIENASFLIIGGAGSIGQAVTKEVFKRNPKLLHVVDLSENNLTLAYYDDPIGWVEFIQELSTIEKCWIT